MSDWIRVEAAIFAASIAALISFMMAFQIMKSLGFEQFQLSIMRTARHRGQDLLDKNYLQAIEFQCAVLNLCVSYFVINKLHGIHCKQEQVGDSTEEICVQESVGEKEKGQEQALWINLIAGGLQVFVLLFRFYFPARKGEKSLLV